MIRFRFIWKKQRVALNGADTIKKQIKSPGICLHLTHTIIKSGKRKYLTWIR